jgi:hypothetical protein
MGGTRVAVVGVGAVVGAFLVVVGGCSTSLWKSDFDRENLPEISAADLGVPERPTPAYRHLSPEEIEALERAGIATHYPDDRAVGDPDAEEDPEGFPGETDEDKTGKAIVSVLTVGVTLGALAAPFFMF